MKTTRVLIFSEDEGLLELYGMVFQALHLNNMVTALDRSTVLALLQSKFDLIFLDVFTGIGISTHEQHDELIRTAQSLQPETPIILVSDTPPGQNRRVFATIALPFTLDEACEPVYRALKLPVPPR